MASLGTASTLGSPPALGTNCRGSFACQITKSSPEYVSQFLNHAVRISDQDPMTVYNSGEHISCVTSSQNGKGGFCLFPLGANLTLEQIRPLAKVVLENSCTKCGSVPVHFVDWGSDDPRWGNLTFNYLHDASCTGKCIPNNVVHGAKSRVRRGQDSYALEAIQS
ncbi:hypothetical protein MMC22_009510 [Lobaria immixta]|nr:hypothetical protein [Lobaria immixta]